MSREIRVLCCNLRSGRADPAALLSLIEQDSVDVVCAQELSPALAGSLSGALPYGDLAHDQVARGSGIASRHPVEIARVRMPKRDGWVALLAPGHWDGLAQPIEIVNVHISGPHLWPYFPHPVRRRDQLAALLADRAARAEIPHAVFGDFNSSPLWPVYRKMIARYADAMIAMPDRARNTWPSIPRFGIRGLLRIDHCFLWKLAARSARVVDLPGSDHLGLRVDLVLPGYVPNL